MQPNEFEKNMQQRMEELTFSPKEEVWQKVEQSLPKEKKRRGVLLFFIFLLLMIGGGIILVKNDNKLGKEKNTAVENTEHSKNIVVQNENEANVNNDVQQKDIVDANQQTTPHNTNAKISPKDKNTISTSSSLPLYATKIKKTFPKDNKKHFADKDFTKVKIKSPVAVANEDYENDIVKADVILEKIIDVTEEKNIVAEKKIEETLVSLVNPNIIKTDTSVLLKKSEVKIFTKTNKNTKESKYKKWLLAVNVATGISNVNAGLLKTKNNVFYDASALSQTAVGATRTYNANKPKPSGAFGVGISFIKPIDNRWQFETGLNYLYLSNKLAVGNSIDTVATFTFDQSKSLESNQHFAAGNSVKYKNKYHFLEIPMHFTYSAKQQSPLHFEAGPSLAYLLQSNGLVYNSGNGGAYLTNNTIFNKMNLLVNVGIRLDVAKKTKLPFTIGYQWKYSANSIVKNSYGKQHLSASLLHLSFKIGK